MRIGDDARQPRRIENTFLEIELPGAILLRHQAALQAVGEAANSALEMGELLVEESAQAVEFRFVAKLFRGDRLVEFLREDRVVDLLVEIREGMVRAADFAGFVRLVAVVVGEVVRLRASLDWLGALTTGRRLAPDPFSPSALKDPA